MSSWVNGIRFQGIEIFLTSFDLVASMGVDQPRTRIIYRYHINSDRPMTLTHFFRCFIIFLKKMIFETECFELWTVEISVVNQRISESKCFDFSCDNICAICVDISFFWDDLFVCCCWPPFYHTPKSNTNQPNSQMKIDAWTEPCCTRPKTPSSVTTPVQ